MFGFPPLPPFEGLHPIAVHFPIGILMIAWMPMVIGLLDKKRRTTWLLSGLLLLVLGTIFLFGAVLTGEATEEFVEYAPQYSSQIIEDAMHEHEDLGELVRNLFIGITIIYLAAFVLYCKMPETKRKLVGIIGVVLVAITYFIGTMALANAGHQGGMLVHDLGVQAPMGASSSKAPGLPATTSPYDNDDDDDD